MIFIKTNIPVSFSYSNYFFGRDLNDNHSIVTDGIDFKKLMETFGLSKNTLWICENISQLGNDFFEFIRSYIPFPQGLKGIELARQISSHPFAKYFELEPPNLWQNLLKLPLNLVETHLLVHSGSKLRELVQLMEEILRAGKNFELQSEPNFEKFRQNLLSLRYEKVSNARAQNYQNAKSLPQPWKVQFLGVQSEQTIELKAHIKDKVDLERAKTLFESKYSELEEIVNNLT